MVDQSKNSLTTRWRAMASIAMVAVIAMLPLLSKTHSVGAQNGTPTSKATPEAAVTKAPTTAPTPVATSTPEPFNPDTASHDQVIAQGLAIFDVAPAIWRVTEIDVPRSGDAESFSGDFSFTLQMEGLSVIRNDVTSKRALLGPGEAYYMSSEDPYTRRAGGSGTSRAWVIEYLPADASDAMPAERSSTRPTRSTRSPAGPVISSWSPTRSSPANRRPSRSIRATRCCW